MKKILISTMAVFGTAALAWAAPMSVKCNCLDCGDCVECKCLECKDCEACN
ncbi:MAG: hypothetical protein AAGJ79_11965 [Verrucomicrobiota bacterium]